MKWSRYSHLFHSKRNGWLLYNSAANSFFRIEEDSIDLIREIMKDPEGFDFIKAPQVYIMLRNGGFLVEDQADDVVHSLLKMRQLTENYMGRTLLLTVAVTRSCNFNCSYCYEGNRTGKPMTEETEDAVIAFIEKHRHVEDIHITWYGGEPLLAMNRIRSFTAKLEKLGKPFSCAMVTNGYLLTQEIAEELNRLKIRTLQITLDGKKETHDARRYLLKDRGPTFDRIINNIDALMQSDYEGSLSIRVNVDSRNEEDFAYVYQVMQQKYPQKFQKELMVYPGFVKGEGHPDVSCFFDSKEKGQFIVRMYEKYGISALNLYPKRSLGGCTLTRRNAYVVGPEGELYKCWDDVGIPELVVGHVNRFDDWNMALIARGMTGCSYLDSDECRQCFYFPICDGGCHKIRLRSLQDGKKREDCSYFKDNLEELLELHYEQKTGK